MGLDILKYSKEGQRIGIGNFDEELHQVIFRNTLINWKEFNHVNLIADYYKTNSSFEGGNLELFIKELRKIKAYMPNSISFKLDKLITEINSNEIYRVRITGD